jgi:hypothetical protein
MICNSCKEEIQDNSFFCNKCGDKIEHFPNDYVAATAQDVAIATSSKKVTSRRIIGVLSVLTLACLAIFIYYNYFTIEAKARLSVDHYLSAIKKGENTYKFKTSKVDDFINVIDFKYLSQRDAGYTNRVSSYTFDRKWYDQFEKSNYKTFEDFLKAQKERYNSSYYNSDKIKAKIQSDTSNELKVEITDRVLSFDFMYDVQATNGFGQLSYRKVLFTVDQKYNDEFEVYEYILN